MVYLLGFAGSLLPLILSLLLIGRVGTISMKFWSKWYRSRWGIVKCWLKSVPSSCSGIRTSMCFRNHCKQISCQPSHCCWWLSLKRIDIPSKNILHQTTYVTAKSLWMGIYKHIDLYLTNLIEKYTMASCQLIGCLHFDFRLYAISSKSFEAAK